MTPNGVKAGKVYSIKPASGSGDFTFTRATTSSSITGIANKEASNGLIKSVAANVPRLDYSDGTCPALLLEPQSTNLITYPVSFPNSYWTKSGASIEGDDNTLGVEVLTNNNFTNGETGWDVGEWVVSTNKAVLTNATTTVYLKQNGVFDASKLYKVTFMVDSLSGGVMYIRHGAITGTAFSSEGVHTEYLTGSSGTLFIRASTGVSATISNISVKEVQGFVSPDGTTNAYKLVEGTNNGSHGAYRSQSSFTPSADYTHSFFVKPSERYKVTIGDASYGTRWGAYNLSTGLLIDEGSDAVGDTTIEALPNGWYRLSIVTNQNSNARYPHVKTLSNDYSAGDVRSYQGDGTSGVYIYGAQLEALSYPTSLIYNGTEGSTMTRTADLCTNSGTVNDFNSAEGVLYIEMKALSDDGTPRTISINGGTSANRVAIQFRATSGQINSAIVVGGSAQSVMPFTISQTIGYIKIALKWKVNDFALWVNGIEVATDTSGSIFSSDTLNSLDCNDGSSGEGFYGKLEQVQVYKEALTDKELYDLTKPLYSSFDVMANALQYDII